MYGCALKYALLYAPPFAHLEIIHLQHHAQALNEEDAAEYGQQQFFVNDDGSHGDNAANGKRTRITHERLCRVSVVPKETNERTNEGAEEHH